jgi:four helix bundle protein
MFLILNHQKLDVYISVRKLVFECYKITNQFPPEEKFGIVSQIRRAVLSVHLNIAEGASRKSIIERKRFFEIARGSLIEIDAALDIAFDLNYCSFNDSDYLKKHMIDSFKMLTGLITA